MNDQKQLFTDIENFEKEQARQREQKRLEAAKA